MLQAREQPYLTLESLGRGEVVELIAEDLDRNQPFMLAVKRDEYRRHPAPAYLTIDPVVVADRGLERVEIDHFQRGGCRSIPSAFMTAASRLLCGPST